MKNQCPKCKVYVDENLKNCPLCGAFIEREEVSDTEQFNRINYGYPEVNKDFVMRKILLQIVIYVCVISIGICLLVNYLTQPQMKITWAYHVIFGWIVYWCTLGRTMFFHLDVRRQIFWYSIFACVICFHIQFSITKTMSVPLVSNWALTYASPAFLMGGIAGLSAYMLLMYRDWVRITMPLTAMCLASCLPVIISLIVYKDVHFMPYICLGVGVAVLLCLMIVGREKYFLELKKKFFL